MLRQRLRELLLELRPAEHFAGGIEAQLDEVARALDQHAVRRELPRRALQAERRDDRRPVVTGRDFRAIAAARRDGAAAA